MDSTPADCEDVTPQDSGCISCSFDRSFLYDVSTPLAHAPSRKRKHHETLESNPASPQFSSTLNESLLKDFEGIDLRKFASVASTPEKHASPRRIAASPIQEAHRILYSTIKPVRAPKRLSTPKKFNRAVRSLGRFDKTCRIDDVLKISCVTEIIFKHLSDNDLFRVSKVSKGFKMALEADKRAYERYLVAAARNKDDKENYVITPPTSPNTSPPRTGANEKFNRFLRIAKSLERDQSTLPCRRCNYPCIVQNNVAQCTFRSCGLIYCLLCPSYSETGPADFGDSCGNSRLQLPMTDASNQINNTFFSSASLSTSYDSGMCSEGDSSPRVKRKLFASSGGERKVLAANNRVTVYEKKWTQETSFVRVIANASLKKERALDSPSPPRHAYAPCSKQSKRNLKRLTR